MVFVAKEVKRTDPDPSQEKKVTSLLSHLLLTRPLPVNPFSAYGRLDCRVSCSSEELLDRGIPFVPAVQGIR